MNLWVDSICTQTAIWATLMPLVSMVRLFSEFWNLWFGDLPLFQARDICYLPVHFVSLRQVTWQVSFIYPTPLCNVGQSLSTVVVNGSVLGCLTNFRGLGLSSRSVRSQRYLCHPGRARSVGLWRVIFQHHYVPDHKFPCLNQGTRLFRNRERAAEIVSTMMHDVCNTEYFKQTCAVECVYDETKK